MKLASFAALVLLFGWLVLCSADDGGGADLAPPLWQDEGGGDSA